jgi:hypothetical protein
MSAAHPYSAKEMMFCGVGRRCRFGQKSLSPDLLETFLALNLSIFEEGDFPEFLTNCFNAWAHVTAYVISNLQL